MVLRSSLDYVLISQKVDRFDAHILRLKAQPWIQELNQLRAKWEAPPLVDKITSGRTLRLKTDLVRVLMILGGMYRSRMETLRRN